jgi:photosystem II stability/assembly factor-like uncharacterized protein
MKPLMRRVGHLISIVGAIMSTALSLGCSGGLPSPSGIRAESRPAEFTPALTPQNSGTKQRFFAVSPVNARVVWASADSGTFAVTTDAGANWRSAVVPGANELQFRDVEGVSQTVAYLLSAGEGANNRIYKTEDGGTSWALQFQAGNDARFFYDCFDFWTPSRGITHADAVDGRFPVIETTDGKRWRDIGGRLPAAQAGEGGFAASGTCITTEGGSRAWIGTGAGAKARILATADGGSTWTSHDVPILQGTPTSGVVSVDFRDSFHGMLGGGDVAANEAAQSNVARSSDGGKTWTQATPTPFKGAVYSLSYVPDEGTTVVATGPGGAAWSPDEGVTWSQLHGIASYWALGFAAREAGWLAGEAGQILKIDFSRQQSDESRAN